MGKLVEGKWVKGSVVTSDKSGAYDRKPRTFLETISEEHPTFQPELGRYHLYVSHACPWAHRTLIYRELKGLAEHISVSVVHPDMLDMGWSFDKNFEGATGDTLFDKKYLQEIYQKSDPNITTTVTVPILWDKSTNQIVNNESSQIIRIFNSAFNEKTQNHRDFYPEELRSEIDQWNEKIYHNVNNGVYKSGFAKTQEAYEKAVTNLFSTLDEVDQALEGKDFLVGNQLTEADLRLIPTLIRFDLVYYIHFKCSIRRISDYKNLGRYTQKLFGMKEIQSVTHFEHIHRHYYFSHESINPYRIVPKVNHSLGKTGGS